MIKYTSIVGIFVIVSLMIITAFIFYIGSKQQAFGHKITIYSIFTNVEGLKTGNAVRLSGVIVGAVDAIDIISDTSVRVTMAIDSKDSKYIKKDAKASVSTEGLLGSKYISISAGSSQSPSISNGDQLSSIPPIDFDKLLVDLSESGNNIKELTKGMSDMVNKINKGEGVLGTMITDPSINNEVKEIVSSFGKTSRNATQLTSKMITVTDSLQATSNNTIQASHELKQFTKKLNNDSSTLGRLLTDTIMADEIESTITELKNTASDVQETSEKVRSSFFVRLFNKNKNNKKGNK